MFSDKEKEKNTSRSVGNAKKKRLNKRFFVVAGVSILVCAAVLTPVIVNYLHNQPKTIEEVETPLSGSPAETGVRFGDVGSVPGSYWPIFSPYEEAVGSGDSRGIVIHGENVIDYWLDDRTPEQCASLWMANARDFGWQINALWSVCNTVADNYYTLYNAEDNVQDLDGALRFFKLALLFVDPYKALIPHLPSGGNVDDMEFARISLQNKIIAYDVEFEVYAQMPGYEGTVVHHGAKHEPRAGVFFGEASYPSGIMDSPKKPSATLIYVEYETEDMEALVRYSIDSNRRHYGYEITDYSVIQIAWNFVREGASLKNVPNEGQKITEAAQYLNSLDVPILLRIGGEMNVWDVRADPAEFIAAYRFIAGIMQTQAPNVALVWSPNKISAQGLNYEMFYPGDDVVDWVGISLYTTKYFMNNPNTSDTLAAIYRVGKYADPVSFIRELVELYGDRKPIYISEGAVQFYNRSNNENLTEWALPRMRQTYAYIPMLFPQVKAMFWFNVDFNSSQSFRMNDMPQVLELYRELTSMGHFLGLGETRPQVTYTKLGTATMPTNAVTLLTYAPLFTRDDVSVRYLLDGQEQGRSTVIPYSISLDLASRADGAYKLTVEVYAGSSLRKTIELNLLKRGATVTVSTSPIEDRATDTSAEVKVFVNGNLLISDQPAFIQEGRTLVPVRAIFEALGASIDWDPDTRTVTAVMDDVVITLVIDSNIMLRNEESILLDVVAQIVGGRTMVPARAVAEALGATVEWDPIERIVYIEG